MTRRVFLVFLLFATLAVALAVPGTQALDDATLRHPSRINALVAQITNPTLLPGSIETFAIKINNPYQERIDRFSLTVEVYRFLDADGGSEVAPEDAWVPRFAPSGIGRWSITVTDLAPGNHSWMTTTITTTSATRFGGWFSDVAFALRLNATLVIGNQSVELASRGHFDPATWDALIAEVAALGVDLVDRPVLEATGYAGILPDSAIPARRPFPVWPRYTLLPLAIVILLGLAGLAYLRAEPDEFPWLQKRLEKLRRKLHQLRRAP